VSIKRVQSHHNSPPWRSIYRNNFEISSSERERSIIQPRRSHLRDCFVRVSQHPSPLLDPSIRFTNMVIVLSDTFLPFSPDIRYLSCVMWIMRSIASRQIKVSRWVDHESVSRNANVYLYYPALCFPILGEFRIKIHVQSDPRALTDSIKINVPRSCSGFLNYSLTPTAVENLRLLQMGNSDHFLAIYHSRHRSSIFREIFRPISQKIRAF
jgi:hypothetical protein